MAREEKHKKTNVMKVRFIDRNREGENELEADRE